MTVQEWLGKDNQLGIDIWSKKYQFENETFDEWIERVSGGDTAVATFIREKKFLFGGRILSNRGLDKRGVKTTLSNCYVIAPPEDNLESIIECAAKLARTFSYGGGCGIDISKLAPKGAIVHNTAKTTSGAVSFMDLYSMITGLIGQNGRRGALMISMDVSHPDIEDFIGIKSDLNRVTKANISVRISDKFMEAVKADGDWELSFTREATGETITKTVKAKELFRKMCEMNWDYAEPGMLFWDRIKNHNLLANTEEFEFAGTNPCAEEPLPAGGSCLLGALNLAEFVRDKQFHVDEFENAIRTAVVALNDVLDEGLGLHPLQEQRDSVRDWRQIGLGVMGIADMLIKLEIPYGSPESIDVCDQIADMLACTAIEVSAQLAKKHGGFPKCNSSEILKTPFFEAHSDSDVEAMVSNYGLRNSQLLTIAPTGTLSTMLGISGGIEPIFANYYTRKTESLHNEDKYYKVYTPIVDKYMKEHGLTNESELPAWFVTAKDLDFRDRIEMQAVFQNHIDASISSTVNVPNSFTVEQVMELYMLAYEKKLKGITIFRENCARIGILTTDEPKKSKVDKAVKDDELIGYKRKLMTGCGSLHLCAYFDKAGNLKETFLAKGSTGGCNNFMIGLSRMISLAARSGATVPEIVDQLKSTGTCPSYAVRKATKGDTSKGSCCPVAIGNALMELWEEVKNGIDCTPIRTDDSNGNKSNDNPNICPECGSDLKHEMGCVTCTACGYSKCG